MNVEHARDACQRMVGTHVFGSFAGLGKSQSLQPDALTRTIRECEWRTEGDTHVFRVVANGFLPHMVRNMVAAIVRVAQSERPATWIDELLAANDRRAMGEAAPASGLTLWRVEYD
jgi:tRNA pseudouridine38-40 synthase